MAVSVKEVSRLMNVVPKVSGKVDPNGKPRWTAEQFMHSLNAALVRRKAPIIDLEQATAIFAEGRDLLNSEQFAVFEQWAEVRIGLASSGEYMIDPPPATGSLSDVIPPVVLPLDKEAADDFTFSDETDPAMRSKYLRGATPGISGRPEAVGAKWGPEPGAH